MSILHTVNLIWLLASNKCSKCMKTFRAGLEYFKDFIFTTLQDVIIPGCSSVRESFSDI